MDPSPGRPEAVRLAAGGLAEGSGVAGITADASLPAAASVSASALLPRKRRVMDRDRLTEAVQDDVNTILGLCGVAKEIPESIEHKGKRCNIQKPGYTGRKRSSARSFLHVYKEKPDAKDATVMCLICHRLGSRDVGNGKGEHQPERSKNPSARALVAKGRKLMGHFKHSERSVAIYKDANVPHDGPCRLLITDVPTRWSSTYIYMARMYTCYSRLAVFFFSSEVGAGARKRQLTASEWDRLRQVLGELKGIFEV